MIPTPSALPLWPLVLAALLAAFVLLSTVAFGLWRAFSWLLAQIDARALNPIPEVRSARRAELLEALGSPEARAVQREESIAALQTDAARGLMRTAAADAIAPIGETLKNAIAEQGKTLREYGERLKSVEGKADAAHRRLDEMTGGRLKARGAR